MQSQLCEFDKQVLSQIFPNGMWNTRPEIPQNTSSEEEAEPEGHATCQIEKHYSKEDGLRFRDKVSLAQFKNMRHGGSSSYCNSCGQQKDIEDFARELKGQMVTILKTCILCRTCGGSNNKRQHRDSLTDDDPMDEDLAEEEHTDSDQETDDEEFP